ncbi:ABC transporter substrate-binding protein [Sphaerisporangium perillae]|uniref:ABC transporter substrate-binding protein n=1 Tax=Sphaerisporangium perillae TaxID=2935860 RepID=UPI00201081ED|nr:ABC transporter substrate-binding protein [Sphaerisporangium perillae]
MGKAFKSASIAGVAALVLSGCASQASSSDVSSSGGAAVSAADQRGDTLTWGWSLPSTWDPVTSAIGNDVHALTLVYEGVTEVNAKGEAQPGLAQSWTYAKDGRSVTFHLRPGLTFSDGTKLDAAAVKASLERGKTAKDSTIAPQLATVESITADSTTDVTLHLTQVDYQIPLLLSGKTGQIVSQAASKDATKLATQPVGAGPFILKSYVPGSQATLVKNPKFWNADKILVTNFILKPTPDPSVAVAGLQSGQFNVADFTASQVSGVKAAGFPVETTDVLPVRVIDVNNTVKPFDNPKVIQAISTAIDRQALVKTANFGYGQPVWQPFPKGYVAHNPELDNLYPHSVTKAKQLLAEAGYPNGINIQLALGKADDPVGELIQQQLNAAGIQTTLTVQTPGANNYITRRYPFALDQFNARQSPVQALQVLFGPQGLMNLGKTTPAALPAAVAKASGYALTDPAYPAAIQAATKIAVTNMPNVFLFTVTRFTAHSPKVHGLQHWVDIQRFEGVWVEK